MIYKDCRDGIYLLSHRLKRTLERLKKGQFLLLLAMKRKISVSLSEETIKKLDEYILDESFRNKSHVIEFAVKKFMKEKEE